VQRDVNGILKHYGGISARLADEFWDELISRIEAAAKHPEHFHFGEIGLRRGTSKNFPITFCSALCLAKFASQLFGTTNAIPNSPLGENNKIKRKFLELS
jgi:hypothetical protein